MELEVAWGPRVCRTQLLYFTRQAPCGYWSTGKAYFLKKNHGNLFCGHEGRRTKRKIEGKSYSAKLELFFRPKFSRNWGFGLHPSGFCTQREQISTIILQSLYGKHIHNEQREGMKRKNAKKMIFDRARTFLGLKFSCCWKYFRSHATTNTDSCTTMRNFWDHNSTNQSLEAIIAFENILLRNKSRLYCSAPRNPTLCHGRQPCFGGECQTFSQV